MNRLEYFSDVKDGKLQKKISALIAREINNFNGKRVKITIERLKSKRSLPQNALFHVYCGFLAKELGYEMEEMKDILKYKFLLGEKVDERTGEIFHFLRHTHKLSKGEFVELIDSVIRFASQLGVVLPEPQYE